MERSLRDEIRPILVQAAGTDSGEFRFSPVPGGSINRCFRVDVNPRITLFCKVNSRWAFPGLFEKESHGLFLLAGAKALRIPAVLACETTLNYQVLVLEWIEQAPKTNTFWKAFPAGLQGLHRFGGSGKFGLDQDNYLGALEQSNRLKMSWTEFLIEERFEPQLALATGKGLIDAVVRNGFEQLYQKLDEIFAPDAPSLLHGDLWSGNFLCDQDQNPVLIDPAVYFGHRSMDLGMTTLFGGFDYTFYHTYQELFPLEPNHREQWEICNLYPLLVHLNLFGQTYLAEIARTIQRF
jgi:protein-ribulosamine 3-kinase